MLGSMAPHAASGHHIIAAARGVRAAHPQLIKQALLHGVILER
jgi:hypothetical protein